MKCIYQCVYRPCGGSEVYLPSLHSEVCLPTSEVCLLWDYIEVLLKYH